MPKPEDRIRRMPFRAECLPVHRELTDKPRVEPIPRVPFRAARQRRRDRLTEHRPAEPIPVMRFPEPVRLLPARARRRAPIQTRPPVQIRPVRFPARRLMRRISNSPVRRVPFPVKCRWFRGKHRMERTRQQPMERVEREPDPAGREPVNSRRARPKTRF